MARSFDVVDVTELMVHWHAGRSQSELAVSLGLDRKTAKKYLAPGAVTATPRRRRSARHPVP